MEETVYNDLIKLCDALIDTALYNLMNVDTYDIWREEYDTDIKACVLVQLRSIMAIKDRIKKLRNAGKVTGGIKNEKTNS